MSSTLNIDSEWANFLSKSNNYDDDETNNSGVDVDTDADEFDIELKPTNSKKFGSIAPEPTPIYISTKSKIAYLLNPIDLTMFWDIPHMPVNSTIKAVKHCIHI